MLPQLLLVLSAIVVLWYASNLFAKANPAKLARALRPVGGVAALGVALLLVVRGHVEVALGLGGFGLYLLGFNQVPGLGGMFGRAGSTGRVSRVRSAIIEMELHHDSGAMQGKVLGGTFDGRQLDDLGRPQCEELLAVCRRDDPDGARLLEAYLDRRFPGWRPAGEGDGDPGRGESRVHSFSGPMTEQEAYEILGLAKGASREDITRAHRTLMKKLHPDHGGSTNLAARVNEAKAVLMRRHG